MCAASGSEQVRFVVETGGTYEWKSSSVRSENRQRFLVQNGAIEQVDEQTRVNMGNPSTLTEFLVWGVENYASEYMGLVLWDHGGGSVTGVWRSWTRRFIPIMSKVGADLILSALMPA